jgi:hypothetical protein
MKFIITWALVIAAFVYAGIWAAIGMYLLQAFVIWVFNLDGLRKHRFFWE